MAGRETEVSLLRGVDILEPLTEREVVDLHSRLPVIRVGKGQILHTPHYRGNMLFLLLSGTIRLYNMSNGHELTLDILRSGTVFGETSLTGEPSQDTFSQGLEASTVSFMRSQTFRELVLRKPEVGIRAIEVLAARNKRYAERMTEMAYKEVTARLASFLLGLAQEEGAPDTESIIPMRYTHWQIATMIGADRVGITRAFKKLREAGAIEQERNRIHIKDVRILREIAEQ